jgi:hypothetical protein
MALSDDIRTLRDQALADLAAAHDYYTDTKIAWRIVHKVIAEGAEVRFLGSSRQKAGAVTNTSVSFSATENWSCISLDCE